MQSSERNTGYSFSNLVAILKHRMWLVVTCTLAVALGTAAWLHSVPNQYRARALLVTEPVPAQAYIGSAPEQTRVQDRLYTIREHLFNPSLLARVIRDFDLYPPAPVTGAMRHTDEMKARIRIEVEGDNAFYVGFEGTDATQVMNVANRLADEFIRDVSEFREQRAGEAAGFLGSELQPLRAQLISQDDKIRAYKELSASELPEFMEANLKMVEAFQTRLQALREGMANDQAKRAALVGELEELKRQGVLEKQAAAAEQSPAQKQLAELKLQLASLQSRYKEAHPDIRRLRGQIADLEASGVPTGADRTDPSPLYLKYLGDKSDLDAIGMRIASSKQEQQRLEGELSLYQKRIRSSPSHGQVLADMVRDNENTRARYQNLLEKQQQAALAERLGKVELNVFWRIAELAHLPAEPFFPRRSRLILLGVAGGLILGVGLGFVFEQLDTSFEDIDKLQAFTNLPVLSMVPTMRLESHQRRTRKPEASALKSTSNPASPVKDAQLIEALPPLALEQYNILATQVLSRTGDDGSGKVIMITSPAGGEGKTTTAINLALTLATTIEGRVLLVDADLRSPRVHRYLGLKVECGFHDLLTDMDAKLENCITTIGSLHLLLGSDKVSNPVQMLASKRLSKIFAELRRQYAFILIDATPILAMADSHILARLSDGQILVIRARRTGSELLQHALESFHTPNILGVVLNDVNLNKSRYAHAYRYYRKNYGTRVPA